MRRLDHDRRPPERDGQLRGSSSAKTFLIIGENTSASQITAAHAPYLVDTLKPRAAWLTTYHSFTDSSSLGNYIAMTSGQFTKCEANNDLPTTCHQRIDNVFQQLQSTGRTWFEFNESAANACDIVDHGAAWTKNIYSAHHNPAIYYTGLVGKAYDEAIAPDSCLEHNLSTGTTAPDDTSASTRRSRPARSARSTSSCPTTARTATTRVGPTTRPPVRRVPPREVPRSRPPRPTAPTAPS